VRPLIAGEQAAVSIVEIGDPAVAGADIELLDQDVAQLQSMPLRARRVTIRLEAAAIIFLSTNLRVRTRTRGARQDLLAYVAFGPHAKGTVNGLTVRPGLMLAAAPGAEAGFVAEPGWESMTVLLPPQEIRAHLAARRREGEFRLPSGVEILQADAVRVRRLFRWGKRLVTTAVRRPGLFNERREERDAAQVELLELLLATLDAATDIVPSRADQSRQAQNRIVKIAEDYALSRARDPLYVSDLCRVAGVGERTLQYAFKQVMGLAPITYLTRVRLHRVRQALLAAPRGSTTISAEALKWGFWHFGEFSRAYRDCFGELPSDTVRRRRDEQVS
jgi:AraC family ethanolamine operon transcriptional activator